MEREKLTITQRAVLDTLGKGKRNKVNIRYIAKLLGISYREVTYTLSELREFYPICCTTLEGGGVWIAESNKDIVEYIKHIEKLKKHHQMTINFMEGHIK